MRLTCPNCGAEYEVSDGMIPPAGRHVQCTACHTRWFVRGASGTDLSAGLTEDQILRRLESWSPRPRPVPVPAAAAAGTGAEPGPEPRPEPRPEATAAEPVVVPLPPRRAAPAKPAERPVVARPAPLSDPARPAPRLDLGEPIPSAVAAPPPPSRSRFAHGFLLALVLAALALGAYLYRDPIAARAPSAGPALTAYGEAVDRWREEIEKRLDRFRADADRGQESPGG